MGYRPNMSGNEGTEKSEIGGASAKSLSVPQTVFKRNKTILYKIFKKYIPVPIQEQENMFNSEIQNISVLYEKILTYKQLEHIFLYRLYLILTRGERNEQIVFFKKHKTEYTDYYYYVTKKGDNDYVICEEVIHHEQVTPTWVVDRYGGKECLKINEREAKEIIELLRKGKYEEFEENYGDRDWIVDYGE